MGFHPNQASAMRATLARRRKTAEVFATWLQGRITALGVDHAGFAYQLSQHGRTVTTTQVQRWTSGSTLPRMHDLPAIAYVLDEDLAALVVRTGRPASDAAKLRFILDPHGSFAARLFTWRTSVNLSMSEAARLSGTQYTAWCRYESGSHVPGHVVILRLADFMGIDPAELAASTRTHPDIPVKADRYLATAGHPLATTVRQRRGDLGMTRADLADALGVTTTTLTSWELGVTKPDLPTLITISKVLRCSLAALLSDYGLDSQDVEAIAHAVDTTGLRKPAQSLGELLRQARKASGFTTTLMGKLVDTDRFVVSRWEHNHMRPALDTLVSYARTTDADFGPLVAAYVS